jgi:nitrogen fixation NifU-like protein
MYDEVILDHYRHPRNFGHTNEQNTASGVSNPSCGDKISMSAFIKDNVIQDIHFEGEGCAISTASASMLTEHLKGKSEEELRKMKSSDMLEILGIELGPNRLKCALLSLEAAQKLLK